MGTKRKKENDTHLLRILDGSLVAGGVEQYERLYGAEKHEILFIPYARVSSSYDGYEKLVQDAFKRYGHKIVSIHRIDNPVEAVKKAEAIAVGGGNTWVLTTRMYEAGIIDLIRDRVNAGMTYVGWSAGGNVACPTLRTTNDMPIAEPSSFNTFGFCPFQTNPHVNSPQPTLRFWLGLPVSQPRWTQEDFPCPA